VSKNRRRKLNLVTEIHANDKRTFTYVFKWLIFAKLNLFDIGLTIHASILIDSWRWFKKAGLEKNFFLLRSFWYFHLNLKLWKLYGFQSPFARFSWQRGRLESRICDVVSDAGTLGFTIQSSSSSSSGQHNRLPRSYVRYSRMKVQDFRRTKEKRAR